MISKREAMFWVQITKFILIDTSLLSPTDFLPQIPYSFMSILDVSSKYTCNKT